MERFWRLARGRLPWTCAASRRVPLLRVYRREWVPAVLPKAGIEPVSTLNRITSTWSEHPTCVTEHPYAGSRYPPLRKVVAVARCHPHMYDSARGPLGSGESHRAHSINGTRSHCGRIVSNQPRLMPTVDAVPHKRVHGGGARLRMLLPVARNDRAMCPGYAAVEYVKVRPRCRRPHPSPALRS